MKKALTDAVDMYAGCRRQANGATVWLRNTHRLHLPQL